MTSTLYIRVLGRFEVSLNGEVITWFPTDRVRGLLLILATSPELRHKRSALATLLWSDSEDSAAKRNLRNCLLRLRKVLGNSADQLIEANRKEIRLIAADSDFRQLQPLLSGDEETDWQRAIQLLNGEFADQFALKNSPLFDEWLDGQRVTLKQQRTTLLNKLLGHSADDPAAQLRYAQQLVEIDPYDEMAHRHVMAAHTACGNVGAAIAHYDQFATLLADELATEPDAATRALRNQISSALHHRPTATVNLPAQVTAFIGRDDERDAVVELLQQPSCRMVTLLGVGGMGKTRLAVEVAQQFTTAAFPDGVYFVPLVTAITQLDVLAQIHRTLSLPTQVDDLKAQVFGYLQDKQLLLVLDNLEQVTGELRFLASLLQQAAGVKILATSRDVVGISAEHRFPLSGIANLHDASELLWSAIQRITPDFELNATNMAIGAKICERLHGVPLALELAATWINTLDLDSIREEIEYAYDFLESPLQDTPDRHRSLSAIFDHSWELLTDKHRLILAKASVVRGGFDMRAARAILGAGIRDLRRLVEQSLLVKADNNRYSLHELVRQFAIEKLTPSDERAIRQARTDYYLTLPVNNELELVGENALTTSALIAADLVNIVAAWRWAVSRGNIAQLSASTPGMSNFYRLTGRFAEGDQLYVDTIERLGSQADDTLLALLHVGCAHFRMWQSRHEESVASAERALAAAKRINNHCLIAESQLARGRSMRALGKVMMAIPIFQQGLAACEHAPESTQAIHAEILGNLALISSFSAARAASVELSATALSAAQRSGNKVIEAFTLSVAAFAHLRTIQLSTTWTLAQKGITLAQSLGNPVYEAASLLSLGGAKSGLGMHTEGIRDLERACHIYQTIGDNLGEIWAYQGLCQILYTAEAFDKMLAYSKIALQLSEARGIALHHGYAHYWHGLVLLHMGQLDAAEHAFETVAQLRVQLQLPSLLDHYHVFGLGEVALAHSETATNASEWIEQALKHIDNAINEMLNGYVDPAIYKINCLSGYKILKANNDPRADKLIQFAYDHVMQTTDVIEIPERRQAYLENNRYTREIIELYQAIN